ncbi:MAG TPA: hypothetical protein V6D29_21760 [Leptolyngbyaceae cyanobacterium]
MTEQNSAEPDPNHQNSVVERQVRPNELMEALGIKKDAYYKLLLERGANANLAGDEGYTPLVEAPTRSSEVATTARGKSKSTAYDVFAGGDPK